jgi:alpha,alpha-trehalose phosphorylase (configuration-retaining)
LQIQHGRDGNGFLVEVGDVEAVAGYLYDLWTDERLYARMSRRAATGVSDEVGTVGNALAWVYLAARLSRGGEGGNLEMNGRWVNDLAREEAEEPYKPGENRLPREAFL